MSYSAMPDGMLRSIPPSISAPDSEYVGLDIESIILKHPKYTPNPNNNKNWWITNIKQIN